jgi:hypothetical protein
MIAEGHLTEREVADLSAKRLAALVRQYTIKDLRADTRLQCLAREHRHPLMWSHYAASHTGLCLHFRVARGSLFGLARKVIYCAEREPLLIPLPRQSEDEVTDRLASEKAEFWNYEAEYRIIGHRNSDWGYRFDTRNRVAFPPDLLSGITLGMNIRDDDRDLILRLAAAHQPAVPVWRASESPRQFWIDVERIQ